MATTALVPAFSRVGVRVQAREQDLAPGAVITSHYRTVGWVYGTTTDASAIPAGAVRIGSVTT